jgi:mannosidase alpha-like ER degradation enhancer 2
MVHAFPHDELKPLTCGSTSTWLGQALTLIDSLDTLLVFGYQEEFRLAVEWLARSLSFDRDVSVSVFEVNIRVLGGLLSAHLLAVGRDWYDALSPEHDLLALAEDLAERLLVAFDTPTGIPYGMVNLRHGVKSDESKVTSIAGAGTFAVEFGTLSRLLNDTVYEDTAKRAARAVFERRSKLGLVGNHINIVTGKWTLTDSGIGAGVDSYFEYLAKGYALLGDHEYLAMFEESYRAVQEHVKRDPWYVDVHYELGGVVWPIFNALQAFWPGLEVLAGHIPPARRTQRAFASVWRHHGVTPEGFNLLKSAPQKGQLGYPLRPELAESAFLLHRATGDPVYLALGRDMIASLQTLARTPCGFASIRNVVTHRLENSMPSFFLAETLKYLLLLVDESNPFRAGTYVFNTEGHLFDAARVLAGPGSAHASINRRDGEKAAATAADAASPPGKCKLGDYFDLLHVYELDWRSQVGSHADASSSTSTPATTRSKLGIAAKTKK